MKQNTSSFSVKYLYEISLISKTNLIVVLVFIATLFSMAGIPPLIGFFAKFFVLKIAFDTCFYSLLLVGLFTSVVSSIYYLNIINRARFLNFLTSVNYIVQIRVFGNFILNTVAAVMFFFFGLLKIKTLVETNYFS